MSDQTITARDRIIQVIEEWVGISEVLTSDERDDLAERIDAALFGRHEDDELEALRAEVRRLPWIGIAGTPARVAGSFSAKRSPLIAALLREPPLT